MNRLSITKKSRIVSALVEGNSINATCRMLGVGIHTILLREATSCMKALAVEAPGLRISTDGLSFSLQKVSVSRAGLCPFLHCVRAVIACLRAAQVQQDMSQMIPEFCFCRCSALRLDPCFVN